MGRNILKREDLTQKILKEYLSYDSITGIFTWIKTPHKHKNIVGEIAGHVSKRDSKIELRFKGTLYMAHRLAWFYVNGEFPKGHIDHINHNEQDNRISNLRDVTQAENNKNQSLRSDNTSGVMGVWLRKNVSKNPYQAEIVVDGEKKYLGVFPTLEEAVTARKTAEIKYSFHPNHGISKPS